MGLLISDQKTISPQTPGGNCIAITETELVAGVDCSRGKVFTLMLTANRAVGNFTGLTCGQPVALRVKQDATGGRTLTWGGSFRFGTTIPSVTLSTAASKTDYIGFLYDASASKIDVVAFVKGF
jgi:hypothetical protein